MKASAQPYCFCSSIFNNPQYVHPFQGSFDQTLSKSATISLIVELEVLLHPWSLEMNSLAVNAIALTLLAHMSLYQAALSDF